MKMIRSLQRITFYNSIIVYYILGPGEHPKGM